MKKIFVKHYFRNFDEKYLEEVFYEGHLVTDKSVRIFEEVNRIINGKHQWIRLFDKTFTKDELELFIMTTRFYEGQEDGYLYALSTLKKLEAESE